MGLFREEAESNHAPCTFLLQPEQREEVSWQLFPLSLPLVFLDVLLCLFRKKNGGKILYFTSSASPLLSAPYLPLWFSPSLFHPSLPSSAGWLIVAPQLRGWHMHQSLTNTTWSPETHSSTKNASVFSLSLLLSFRLCHLSMSSISLQSDTRALSSILQNDHFPVCFKKERHCRDLLTNVHFILTLFTSFSQREKKKWNREPHKNKAASIWTSAAQPPGRSKSLHPGSESCFISGNCCVNACWGFVSHQMSGGFASR